jgi:hypothetical protein
MSLNSGLAAGESYFEIAEVKQLEAKSWLRIFVAILSFLVVSLVALLFLWFLPASVRLPSELMGPLVGIFIILATVYLTSKLLFAFKLIEATAGVHLRLSAREIVLHSNNKVIENRDLQFIRSAKFQLEIKSPSHGNFLVPEFVKVELSGASAGARFGPGILGLRVVDKQLRLESRSFDGFSTENKLIDF